jgi:hypothetical protein
LDEFIDDVRRPVNPAARDCKALCTTLLHQLTSNPDTKATLMRSHWGTINRFQREYRMHTVELRRRYPLR